MPQQVSIDNSSSLVCQVLSVLNKGLPGFRMGAVIWSPMRMLDIQKEIPRSEQQAYLVGGSVRDLLLKRKPADFDIAVPENPQHYAAELARKKKSRVIEIGKAGKSIFRIVCGQTVFDISPTKGESIEDDLRQRDFTINALAYDLVSGDIIDVTGGQRDLQDRRIRMVARSVFQQDPVRLLRAYRIAVMTGFDMEADTAAAIRQDRYCIKVSAGERIREELFGIFKTGTAATAIAGMADNGLLMEIFPELNDLAGCQQNRHHEFDALKHTLNMFGHLESLLNHIECHFPKSAEMLTKTMDRKRGAVLKCAALLHDIGKPAARTMDHLGQYHFYGHEKIGAQLARNVCARLRFSNDEGDSIAFIVRNHLRPLFLFNAGRNTALTNRAWVRFFLSCGALVPDLVLHAVADSRGKIAEVHEKHAAFEHFAQKTLELYKNSFQPKTSAPPLITGHDLIRIYSLPPSPVFKTVLQQVEEARIAGEIHSKAEAEGLARTLLEELGQA